MASQQMRAKAEVKDRRAERRHNLKALCLMPCVVVFVAACWHASSPEAPSFTGGVRKLEREPLTVMQYKKRSIALKKPFYSKDAERFAEIEQDWRHERRSGQAREVVAKPDMSKLPSTADIFARKFSGEADQDPVGGRKWYSLYLVYGADAGFGARVRFHVIKLSKFLRGKLSAKNLEVSTISPPSRNLKGDDLPVETMLDAEEPALVTELRDGDNRVTGSWPLEMAMKVYGDVEKKGSDVDSRNAASSPRTTCSNGYLMRWDFQLPPSAIEPLSRILYQEKSLLRFMFLKHTRQFHHVGEDNELLL